MTKRKQAAKIRIDYPKLNENITGRDYTFRIKSDVAGTIEMSIDDDCWLPCRQSVGYWWYDWSSFRPGKHKAVARVRSGNGSELATYPRRFTTNGSPKAGRAKKRGTG